MHIRNTELKVVQGDITDMRVDAIVNPANDRLLMGGGVAGAIRRKGGQSIEDEAAKKGPIAVGDAVATSAGSLKNKYIIHAVTMGMDFKTDEKKIRLATASALRIAEKLNSASVAFPALGCGVGGFDLQGAARIMAQAVLNHLADHKHTSIKEIIFCLHDRKDFNMFQKTFEGYLTHMREQLGWGPYVTVDMIIEMPEGIILIERSNPPFGWALPGGFVDRNESIEDAAHREAKEETSLELDGLRQFHTYSDPGRDPRFHTVSTVFIAQGRGVAQFGDDAKGLKIVPYNKLLSRSYAFDHGQVIADYLKSRSQQQGHGVSSQGDH